MGVLPCHRRSFLMENLVFKSVRLASRGAETERWSECTMLNL